MPIISLPVPNRMGDRKFKNGSCTPIMSCFGVLPPASICCTQPSADPGLGPGGGPVLSFFLAPTPTRTARPIFTLYGSNDMLWLAQGQSFWGLGGEDE